MWLFRSSRILRDLAWSTDEGLGPPIRNQGLTIRDRVHQWGTMIYRGYRAHQWRSVVIFFRYRLSGTRATVFSLIGSVGTSSLSFQPLRKHWLSLWSVCQKRRYCVTNLDIIRQLVLSTMPFGISTHPYKVKRSTCSVDEPFRSN